MPPSGAGSHPRILARAAALLALLLLPPSLASAEPRSVPAGEAAVGLVRNFWDLVASQQGEERTARPEPSRPNLKENTRVVSEMNACSCRSNISFTCSSHESGTPAGALGSSRVSPLVLRASIRAMRCSISRRFVAY